MLHQVPTEWEVVDAYAVEPTRVYVEDDGATIVRLASHEIVGAYTFDLAPTPPVRPVHQKRHSHDGSSASKATDEQQAPAASRRASHPASSRPHPPAEPIQRTMYPASIPAESPPSSPKPTRLGSALSFFRTHSEPHPSPDQRRRPSFTGSSDSSGSGSGSGSSDGDSEAVPKRHLLGRRRGSTKSSGSGGSCFNSAVKKPTAPVVESHTYRKADLKKALMFARGELMKQVTASGKNALVLEGWSITVLRQSSRYRIRIEYTGRPAIISYPNVSLTKPLQRLPPFLEVLGDH